MKIMVVIMFIAALFFYVVGTASVLMLDGGASIALGFINFLASTASVITGFGVWIAWLDTREVKK